MATYTAIRNLFDDSALLNRVAVAVIIAANGILGEVSANAKRKAWAGKAFAGAENEAKRILLAVLAANSAATVAAIKQATDADLQTNVDNAIELFIDVDAEV